MNWRGSMRRAMAYLVVAVVGFMIFYLVAAFVVFPSGGVIPQDVEVPPVTGLSYDQAAAELRRAGFQVEEGETRFHATSPKGTVLEQTPAAGTRDLMGTTVSLAISGGQASQPVPNVVGMSRDDAERELARAGFDVAGVEERSSAQPRGEIIDTRPRPGTSATVPGDVTLIVSGGQNTVATPDLVGLGLEQARQLLAAAGLSVGEVAYDVAPGATIVTTQSPAPTTQVAQGSRVSLRVSGEVPPVSRPAVAIAPSILSADFARLGDDIAMLEAAGADWIHVDVMDGHFVPNLSFGAKVIETVRRLTALPIDVHLMVVEPERYFDDFAAAGATGLTIHPEVSPHLHRQLARIRELGCRAGAALNPSTPLDAVVEVLPDLDLLLVMTVNPGYGGQRFIAPMVDKVRRARQLLDRAGSGAWLQVDGGINRATIVDTWRAGADAFVAGNAVFAASDPAAEVAALRAECAERA